jgi:2-polyprenyl-3-methyl-5-hydroxy-6-metoxy-1,4-benzoquinol methylase
MIACPACLEHNTAAAREHSVADAAAHLVSPRRDPQRQQRQQAELRSLFGSDRVQVRRCGACGFWFAHPFVAGTPAVYNLITDGDEHYPANRFEFEQTIASLPRGALDVLEIGAGDGAFLRQLAAAGIRGRVCATEYDDGSLGKLRAIPGTEAFKLSPQELVMTGPGRFDAVCMFQVLEHLDRLDEVFAAVRELTAPGGRVFIAVPNDASVTVQEDLTGFWEMPPNHIGRWTRGAMDSVAARHGLAVQAHRYEPVAAPAELWTMAKCRYDARAYRASSLAGRVNGVSTRPLRGVMKRGLTVWDLLVLARNYGRFPPRSQWFALGAA